MKKDKEETVDIVPLVPYIVHQLKTPLTAISGFSDILLHAAERKLSDKEMNYLSSIAESSVVLLNMLNSLSEFSKLESGQRVVNAHNFLINDVVESIIDEFTVAAAEKGISIETAVNSFQVFADFGMAHRALKSLLDNSIKNSSRGGTITVRVTEAEDCVNLTVIDDGNCIDKEILDNIFDVEYQIRHHTSNTGIGLGLAIAKRSIELQGGSICVNSVQGIGTNVKISLPKKVIPPISKFT